MEHFGSPALRRLLEFFPRAVEATHAALGDATAQDRIRELVLQAYAEYEEAPAEAAS